LAGRGKIGDMKRLRTCPFNDVCSPGGCSLFDCRGEGEDFSARMCCVTGFYEDCPIFLEQVLRFPGQNLEAARDRWIASQA